MKALRAFVMFTVLFLGFSFSSPVRSQAVPVTMGEMFNGAIIHCPLQQEAIDMVEAYVKGGVEASDAVFQKNSCQFSVGAYLPIRQLSLRIAHGYAISVVRGTRVAATFILDGEVTYVHVPYFLVLLEKLGDMQQS